MSPYWVGLLTLPAIAGVLAALYGLYRAGGALLDRTVVLWVRPAGDVKIAANFAAVVASTKRALTVLRISRLISVHISIGSVDAERADAVRRAVLDVLAPRKTISRRTPGGGQ